MPACSLTGWVTLEVAEMAHLLLTDQALRAQVIAGQRERLRSWPFFASKLDFKQILAH